MVLITNTIKDIDNMRLKESYKEDDHHKRLVI